LVGAAPANASAPAKSKSKSIALRAKIVAKIAIPPGTGGMAIGEGAVWSLNWSTWSLMRIDPHRNVVTARISVKPTNPCPPSPDTCGQVAAGNGAMWVSMRPDNVVARVDPTTSKVTATIPVGESPDGIASSPGAVWVANHGTSSGPSVSRIDPATNQVVATISVGPAAACCSDHMAVTAAAGSVWVTVPNNGAVVRIDQATNAVIAAIRMSGALDDRPCAGIAVSQDSAWVAGGHCDNVITRIDLLTNKAAGKVSGSASPIGVGLAFGSLWVADLDARAVERVDPRTRRIIGSLPVGKSGVPVWLTIGFGSIWVRNEASDNTGRVLRIAPAR
jgi:YVTN family beta-propeller protein